MKQAFNPYLPSYEYIPDGEPYVFGDRVYIYGSHDRFNGRGFCLNDYVCWSAPVDDLGNWRYEGVIYRKEQDPINKKGKQYLYAPDVANGADGRYYLFYALNNSPVISVAVCEAPAGEYRFHGHVHFADGHVWGAKKGEVNNFDPGTLFDDDGRMYLYSGFAPKGLFLALMKLRIRRRFDGAYCVELAKDMLTITSEPKLIIPGPGKAKGTGFEEHPFFEASSMRKIAGRCYFIYSSVLSHELCYAVSDKPDGGFVFGGTIVSNCDIGFKGNTEPLNYYGNTHGSIVEINGQWYVFYHRQTNRSQFSRQACAERIEILPDGSIPQVEMTSCGLNNGPLAGTGEYEARIACNLADKKGARLFWYPGRKGGVHPYFTQSGEDRENSGDQYIANMRDGAWAGFKYFHFQDERNITVTVRGDARGVLRVSTQREGRDATLIAVTPCQTWTELKA
ncbi:MAG: family 43 glycosylhydrolase, partial [Treponema sp.]|nr:family 43 glycosylhydrolase [Treponema sp.]